jgi:hypothetical protein
MHDNNSPGHCVVSHVLASLTDELGDTVMSSIGLLQKFNLPCLNKSVYQNKSEHKKVLAGVEPAFQESESYVITATLQDLTGKSPMCAYVHLNKRKSIVLLINYPNYNSAQPESRS